MSKSVTGVGPEADPVPAEHEAELSTATPSATRTLAQGFDASALVVFRRLIRRYLVVALIPISFFTFAGLDPGAFLNLENVQGILTTNSALLVVAIGVTLSMVVGEWDLSFFGLMGCSAGFFATIQGSMHLGQLDAFLVTFAFAVLVGATNAFIIVRLRVASFITTLGMAMLTEGIGLGVTNSQTVSISSSWLDRTTTTNLGGVGLPFYYGLAAAIACFYVLEHTRTGRHLYFTGEGRAAAQLAGVKVNRLRAVALIISAISAWAGGLILGGQTGSANATFGLPYITLVLASIFLGYACIRVGRFNPIGTFVGVFVLGISSIGLQVATSASWGPDVFTGALLVASIVFATVLGKEDA